MVIPEYQDSVSDAPEPALPKAALQIDRTGNFHEIVLVCASRRAVAESSRFPEVIEIVPAAPWLRDSPDVWSNLPPAVATAAPEAPGEYTVAPMVTVEPGPGAGSLD